MKHLFDSVYCGTACGAESNDVTEDAWRVECRRRECRRKNNAGMSRAALAAAQAQEKP